MLMSEHPLPPPNKFSPRFWGGAPGFPGRSQDREPLL